jgi:hypothetical protein
MLGTRDRSDHVGGKDNLKSPKERTVHCPSSQGNHRPVLRWSEVFLETERRCGRGGELCVPIQLFHQNCGRSSNILPETIEVYPKMSLFGVFHKVKENN